MAAPRKWLPQLEYALRPESSTPAWRVGDLVRRGYAITPAGHGLAPSGCGYPERRELEIVGVRGSVATDLFKAGYALADFTLRVWAEKYGAPRGYDYRPAHWYDHREGRMRYADVPFFVHETELPAGKMVRETPGGMRYVVRLPGWAG